MGKFCELEIKSGERKDGVPSLAVVTMGLSMTSPPRSNSWADILRAGVVVPDPGSEDETRCSARNKLVQMCENKHNKASAHSFL